MEAIESEGWPDQIDWDLCLRTSKVITQWEKNWLEMRMVSVRTQTVRKAWFRFRTVGSLKDWHYHSMGTHIHLKHQIINNVNRPLDFLGFYMLLLKMANNGLKYSELYQQFLASSFTRFHLTSDNLFVIRKKLLKCLTDVPCLLCSIERLN